MNEVIEGIENEEWHTCEWRGEEYPESELHEEIELGCLYYRCCRGIASRGEPLYRKN